jgi:hypothetical protein
LKPDWEFTKSVLGRPRVVRADGFGEMRAKADSSLRDYSKILWQGHVSGMQVGVSLWRHNGRFVAENMVLGQHTYPHNAGNMSLRRSWWHEAILADAKAKLASLDWCGVAMMEYIWSPERDDFWFIEVNPRFWGYLHLDLACNKDFPRWQMDAHFGQLFESSGPPTRPATMRYVAPGEVIYVASRCLDPDVGIGRKLYSLAEFLVLGVNPLIGADMWFAGDRYMYVRRWYRFLREVPSTVLRAIRRGRTST